MPYRDIQHLHISTGTIIRFFAVALVIAALFAVRDILFSLFFAVIIASAVEPAVEWLKERKIPRLAGVIMIYLTGLALFFLLIYLVFPLFAEEMRIFLTSYPALEEQVRSGIVRAGTLPILSFFAVNIEGLLRVPSSYLQQISGSVADVASAAFGGIFSSIIVVVFSFYLAAQEKGIENFLRLVTPLPHESYVLDLWRRSQKKLGRWLRAQLLLGAIIGVLIFFGLTILGVKHALFFAALSAVFEIIPVVGPILAAVPGVAVALLADPLLGVLTLGLYVAAQQVESHVIVPVIMRRTVDLSPLIVVFALLVGGKLGGIFGIMLAVPLTAILAELLNDWDKKKRSLIPE